MTAPYYTLLTNIGAAKLANATATDTPLNITQMGVGDANGTVATPDPGQTSLIHECRRADLNTLKTDPNNPNQIIAEQVLPDNVGGWYIRELGLYDADGDLIAVGNCPPSYKPLIEEGASREQVIRMILIVSSDDAVTLKIDPAVVLATREYVDDSIEAHAKSRNHPDATTKAKGLVQLSSETDSDDETKAATPKAVKAAKASADAAVKTVSAGNSTHKPDASGNVKLGSAADADIVTSMTDTTAGRVPIVGWMSLGGYGTDNLIDAEDAKKSLRNGFYGVQSDPAYGNASLISFGYDSGSQVHIIAKQGGQTPLIGLAGSTPQGDFGNWGKIYTEFQKPTAIEVGAVPYRGALGTVDLNTIRGTRYGRFNQSMTANATTARNYPIAEAGALDVHQASANGPESCVQEYRSFSSRRIFLRSYNQLDSVWTDWCEYYTTAKKPTAADVGAIPLSGSTAVTGIVRNSAEFQSTSANNFRIAYGGYGAFWRNDGIHLYLMLTNKGDPLGNYNALRPFWLDLATGDPVMSRLSLTDYTNFDARYNTKYPTGHRIGARTKISGLNSVGDWSSRIPQGAINIASMTMGDDRITDAYYAYPQYLINGNWVNFA